LNELRTVLMWAVEAGDFRKLQIVSVFRRQNKTMKFRDAFEDFRSRTLAVLPGRLQRLEFLSSFRRDDGTYEHWGMEQEYGQEPAGKAIADVHSEAFLDVVSVDVPTIVTDAEKFLCSDGSSFLEQVEHTTASICPSDTAGGSTKHWDFIRLCLRYVQRGRQKPPRTPGA
jgi:hypothetical protein